MLPNSHQEVQMKPSGAFFFFFNYSSCQGRNWRIFYSVLIQNHSSQNNFLCGHETTLSSPVCLWEPDIPEENVKFPFSRHFLKQTATKASWHLRVHRHTCAVFFWWVSRALYTPGLWALYTPGKNDDLHMNSSQPVITETTSLCLPLLNNVILHSGENVTSQVQNSPYMQAWCSCSPMLLLWDRYSWLSHNCWCKAG